MSCPDIVPWFDTVADEYHELPAGEDATPYDE
jgi:hypothetical protein